MAERIIIWTKTAKIELKFILEYYNLRNKSKTYSQKLLRTIQSEIKLLVQQTFIGKKTDTINVRGLLIENFIVFYEVNESHIIILSVWDTRQNPATLNL